MSPAVSVIIPTYNRSDVIGMALRSVLDQTYQDFEIVVVDDGSDDQTAQAVALAQSEKIRLETIKHAGPSAARNRGIEVAAGELIAFLDSDDVWYPTKLGRQTRLFDNPEVGWTYTDLDYEGPLGPASRRFERRRPCRGWVLEHIFVHGYPMLTSSVMVRRSCLDHTGLFDPLLLREQDNDLYMRLSLVAQTDYIDEPLGRYTHRNRHRSTSELKLSRERLRLVKKRAIDRSPELANLPSDQFRKAYLFNVLELGRLEMAVGDVRKAQEYFAECRRLDPMWWKPYVASVIAHGPAPIRSVLVRGSR